MTQSVFMTSDQHWDHDKIRILCDRKFNDNGKLRSFKDVDEMNEVMIQRWNERIKPNDIVYHLGDFSYKSKSNSKVAWIFGRLNGVQKFLIAGNHDDSTVLRLPWTHVYGKHGEYVTKIIKIDNQQVALSHHAHRVWPSSHYSVWHLYAHSHNTLPPSGFSFDVGVDGNDYYPWEWSEIKDKMKTLDYKNHPDAKIIEEKLRK